MKGSYVALVTPFKNNEIDYNSLENLIEFHLKNKTDGILLCGTTGETPTLANDERDSLLRFGIQKIGKKIPVLVGTGTNNLNHTIALTQKAQKFGADYALIITPYYNKPTQEGLYRYFKEVIRNTDIPIVIYNVPGRTGINITAETTLRIAKEFKQVIAIKEASGNMVQVSKIIRDAPEGFSVMSGEDALNYPILCCGGTGTISVTANILPQKVHDLFSNYEEGNIEKARSLHLDLLEINLALFLETNPIPVKDALAQMGMIENEMRLPLFNLKEENKIKLGNTLKKYNLI